MPGMDGFETAALIKEREKSRHVPILFVTANSADEGLLARGYAAGAADYIRKPFNADILRAKVAVFVDLYQQREEIKRQAELLREQELITRERDLIRRERDLLLAEARQGEEMAKKQRRFLREVLSSLTEGRLRLCDMESGLPAPLTAVFAEPIALTQQSLRALRSCVIAFAEEADWHRERRQDFETAVGEAGMNAVVHGRNAYAEIRGTPADGTAQVWIRDEGHGIDENALHRATLEKGYTTAGSLGHGFWMMLKTADRVYLLTGPSGTTVVLEQDRHPQEPAWMRKARS